MKKCLHCKWRVSKTRGLCRGCYQSAQRLIAKQKTSWEKLEQLKLATAPKITHCQTRLINTINRKRENNEC